VRDIPRFLISSFDFLSLPIELSFREGPVEGPRKIFLNKKRV
jgi:hypothetical protein